MGRRLGWHDVVQWGKRGGGEHAWLAVLAKVKRCNRPVNSKIPRPRLPRPLQRRHHAWRAPLRQPVQPGPHVAGPARAPEGRGQPGCRHRQARALCAVLPVEYSVLHALFCFWRSARTCCCGVFVRPHEGRGRSLDAMASTGAHCVLGSWGLFQAAQPAYCSPDCRCTARPCRRMGA